jgi:hypothetical protein
VRSGGKGWGGDAEPKTGAIMAGFAYYALAGAALIGPKKGRAGISLDEGQRIAGVMKPKPRTIRTALLIC